MMTTAIDDAITMNIVANKISSLIVVVVLPS